MSKVLVVDDDDDISELMRSVLADLCQHEVRVASSGEEGLEEARVFAPNVVVTDFRMPGMSGTEMIRRLVDEGLQAGFVLTSGFAGGGLTTGLESLVADGTVRILQKPFSFQTLVRSVQQALGHSTSSQMDE